MAAPCVPWHQKPSLILTLIGLIFAGGGWLYVTDFRAEAIEKRLNSHSKLEMHPRAGDRLIRLETHMGYVRRDVTDIKDLVKDLNRKLDKQYKKDSR